MSKDVLLDIDLDYFNDYEDPDDCVKDLLAEIPNRLPSVILIEHHEILPEMKRWVSAGVLRPPFEIWHVDEHHDFYYQKEKLDCGNWGFHIPKQFYKKFIWIYREKEMHDCWWRNGRRWLNKNRKEVLTIRDRVEKIPFDKVKCVSWTVSPDYIENNVRERMIDILRIISDHFKTVRRIARPKDHKSRTFANRGNPPFSPGNWEYVPLARGTKR